MEFHLKNSWGNVLYLQKDNIIVFYLYATTEYYLSFNILHDTIGSLREV